MRNNLISFVFIEYLTHIIELSESKCSSSSPCISASSTNKYGGERTDKCFEVKISDIKEIQVYTSDMLVGFTFKYIDGTNKSYMENNVYSKNYSIQLANIEITGVNMNIRNGIESIQFQIFNSSSSSSKLTEIMGKNQSGCFTYPNSNSFNSPCLGIKSIHGCIDDKNLNYFPYLAFSYSFSVCPKKTKSSRFLALFSNISLNPEMFQNTNPVIRSCRNIATAIINGVQYNLVVDQNVGVYLYDLNWKYNATFAFPNILYAIVVNNFYYFSTCNNAHGVYGIVKTSTSSPNVDNHYGSINGVYRGLYFDESSSRIVAAGWKSNMVDVLDLSLSLVMSISVQQPHSIRMYNSKIYVGEWNTGIIVVITNGTVATYASKCTSELSNINVDSAGYFVISCHSNGIAYLYDSNLQYTNKSTAVSGIFDTNLDLNNRLAICSLTNVFIYN